MIDTSHDEIPFKSVAAMDPAKYHLRMILLEYDENEMILSLF